jgi:ubiquinone/menaquinone biosynthesis C-methylase UbiE
MEIEDSKKLPDKDHYAVSTYLGGARVHSYAHQIGAVLDLAPTRVLEVGKGPGMVAAALRALAIEVITLDMQSELHPDIVGSVTQIPLADRDVDVSLCCQVLEHLPFDQFATALHELRRVTKVASVMSLPDLTAHHYIKLKLPKLNFSYEISVPRRARRISNGQGPGRFGHYWEIGCEGSSFRDVRNLIARSGWKIDRTWRVPELSWHRFFLLK